MSRKPDAFLSYTRFDDEDGEISAFRERLSRTVRQVSGEPFIIFQDVDDDTGIALGERWKDKLNEMLDQARFFIPILTPSFFRSKPCRLELRTFLELERNVGRRDLVLPIYWITCPMIEEGNLKAGDDLAKEIDERQRWDWRELIFEDLQSPICRRGLYALSSQIERARRVMAQSDKAVSVVDGATKAQSFRSALMNKIRQPQLELETPRRRRQAGLSRSEPKAAKRLNSEPLEVELNSLRPERSAGLSVLGEIFQDIKASWCPEMIKIVTPNDNIDLSEHEGRRFDKDDSRRESAILTDFALGCYPVTFDEYDHFCEVTGREKPEDMGLGRALRPVTNVSYRDAEAYCTWLSEIAGASYRLPTEAEWDFAHKTEIGKTHMFGAGVPGEPVIFGRKSEKRSSVSNFSSKGTKSYDTDANIWEWCHDNSRSSHHSRSSDSVEKDTICTLRGSSWEYIGRRLRPNWRRWCSSSFRSPETGFRCARDLE